MPCSDQLGGILFSPLEDRHFIFHGNRHFEIATLAEFYLFDIQDRKWVGLERNKAEELSKSALAAKDSTALCVLGDIYQQSRVIGNEEELIPHDASHDMVNGRLLWLEAANLNSPDAQYRIGCRLYRDQRYEDAVRMWRRSAAGGHYGSKLCLIAYSVLGKSMEKNFDVVVTELFSLAPLPESEYAAAHSDLLDRFVHFDWRINEDPAPEVFFASLTSCQMTAFSEKADNETRANALYILGWNYLIGNIPNTRNFACDDNDPKKICQDMWIKAANLGHVGANVCVGVNMIKQRFDGESRTPHAARLFCSKYKYSNRTQILKAIEGMMRQVIAMTSRVSINFPFYPCKI